jgi:hypothetical protein
MIIKYFKLFETRTTELSDSEFRDILNTNCKEFINNPMLLQRSKRKKDSDFGYIDPSKHIRTSMKHDEFGTNSEHHLLLMDNLPSWKDFPKRSRSIIGTTRLSTIVSYGSHRYLVIPFDNAQFAVAPGEDLWTAGSYITDSRPMFDDLEVIFDDEFSTIMLSNNISDKSYKELIDDFQKIMDGSVDPYGYKDYMIKKMVKIFKKNGYTDAEKALSHYLSPERFYSKSSEIVGFNTMNYNTLTKYNRDYILEFWTESPCLLYYMGQVDIKDKWESFKEEYI